MNTIRLHDGFSVARMNTRQRIENTVDLNRLYRVIDSDPAIVGAGVVYIDADFNVITLREFQSICSVAIKRVILREPPRYMGAQEFAKVLETRPRDSELAYEASGMTVACIGAIISWSVIATSGTVLIPFSAGTSSVVAYIGFAAALATTAQCLNGAYRTHLEAHDPEYKDDLDSKAWYEAAAFALDAVSLFGVAITAGVTFKLISTVKASTGKNTLQLLRGLNRQERKALTRELLLIKDPRLTPKLLKLRQAAGELPGRFTPVQIRQSTKIQIADCVSMLPDVAGSFMSGILKVIAIGIFQEVTND